MQDETQITGREDKHSHILGLSLRGAIALIVILTVCIMSVFAIDVKEPLYTLAGLIVGFYYGQNKKEDKK